MGVRAVGDELLSVTLRPQVPMGAFQALGFVCAMGAAEGLREAGVSYAAIGWPQDVVDARTYRPLMELRLRAGYDKGMYAACTVVASQQIDLLRKLDSETLAEALRTGIERRVALWEQAIVAGGGAAGPLAPVLSEYFDLVALLGQPVQVIYPNGNEMTSGTFAGVDVWGHATVIAADGSEVEFAPEHASIRPA